VFAKHLACALSICLICLSLPLSITSWPARALSLPVLLLALNLLALLSLTLAALLCSALLAPSRQMEKVKEFEAHNDYIRYLEVHPTLPYVISAADDMSMKLWNWDKGWDCTQVFEGHAHYVMMVKFNLKDTNTFASASLDRTVRVPKRTCRSISMRPSYTARPQHILDLFRLNNMDFSKCLPDLESTVTTPQKALWGCRYSCALYLLLNLR